jgi:membrane-associated phospholipid phosphatase
MIISLFVYIILIYDNPIIHPNASGTLTICFLFSNLLPIITIIVLQRYGIISDLDASIRKQRIIPLSLGVLYAAIGFIVLTLQNAEAIVRGLMFCFITNTVIIILITRYWKISIHTMGVAGLIAALWVNGEQFPLIMGFILVLVASARVVLKAHNIPHVLVGSFLGIILTYVQLHLIFI